MNEKSERNVFWKKVIHFSIIPKDDPQQALRIRRFFIAFAVYILNAGLAYASYLANIMEWQAIAGFLIIIPVINITLYIVFRTGLNLRMADPSLTAVQMCAAILVTMYGMYFANESRGVLLMIYVIILLFGVYRLNTRSFLLISVFTLMTYGAVILLLRYFRPQGVNFNMEYLQWIVLAMVLTAFSIIGGHISSLRRNLRISRAKLEKSLATIQEMSIRDDLTGVYNRRHLLELFGNEKNRAFRGGSSQFSIAMLDIDHFKAVNDTHGHLTGDEVLRAVANVISNSLRSTDFCGRYGGEEFLLVMTQTSINGAMLCAERVRSAVEERQLPKVGSDFRITVSLGLAEYHDGETIEIMIAHADQALYRAKNQGRNRVVCDK